MVCIGGILLSSQQGEQWIWSAVLWVKSIDSEDSVFVQDLSHLASQSTHSILFSSYLLMVN